MCFAVSYRLPSLVIGKERQEVMDHVSVRDLLCIEWEGVQRCSEDSLLVLHRMRYP